MKKFALIMTLMTTLFGSSGRNLATLWKSYYKASDSDRPEEMLSALEDIRKEAFAQHSVWDYYDACDKYREVKVRQNWKEAAAQEQLMRERINELGEPVALFYLDRNRCTTEELSRFVTENKTALERSRTPGFYSREALSEQIRNDYDYTLWFLYFRNGAFESQLAASYPVHIQLITKTRALQEREDALMENPVEDECLKLRDDCRRFIADAEKLPAGQRDFARSLEAPELIVRNLESKDIRSSIKDGRMTAIVRNLDRINAVLKDESGKVVWKAGLENDARRFYVEDTLTAELPILDDGTYTLECSSGKTESDFSYTKLTISAALREDAEGWKAFVADHRSGEPLKACELILVDSKGGVIASSGELEAENGFISLPAEFQKKITGEEHPARLMVQTAAPDGHIRKSDIIRLYGRTNPHILSDDESKALILTDRGAYCQGDTIRFKAILYKGSYSHSLVPEGTQTEVRLIGPGGKEIDRRSLVTGVFGSVASEFATPSDGRGGMYSIRVAVQGKNLSSHSVRVDEFQVPTFTLDWDTREEIYLPIDTAHVRGTLRSYSGHSLSSADIVCSVEGNGGTEERSLAPDSSGRFDIVVTPSKDEDYQHFSIAVRVSDSTGETREFRTWLALTKKPEEPTEYFFKTIEGENPAIRVVAGKRSAWVVAELFGNGDTLLEKRLVRLDPQGDSPAEGTISWPYKDNYPDVVTLKVLYFQNSRSYSSEATVRRPRKEYLLPLEFIRFRDAASPGEEYSFLLRTAPDTECAAAIFDISTENIQSNRWQRALVAERPVRHVSYNIECGKDGAGFIFYRKVPLAGARMMALNSAADNFETAEAACADSQESELSVRSNFANTIAWEPMLHSGSDGDIELKFRTADKLSTYCVQLFAHDKDFNNNILRREMLVTIPVKVSVVEPKYLYESDSYSALIGLSNSLGRDVAGSVSVKFLAGSDYRTAPVLSSASEDVTVPAGGTAELKFGTVCPQGLKKLGMLVSFQASDKDSGSDAVFVCIDVKKPVQTITEAHSAILTADADRAALEARLRGEFTGVSADEASAKEISILDMLLDTVPDSLEPGSEDILSLTEVLYADALLCKLGVGRLTDGRRAEIAKKVSECLNPDGGYAWFKGMDSSPIITAAVLQRARMSGMNVEESSVRFLDSRYFSDRKSPRWLGGLSLEQYAYVRSLYPEVEFSAGDVNAKDFKEFKKSLKEYLLPKGKRGLDGMILAKVRRIKTLRNLQGGRALASAWGIRLGSRVVNSIADDLESISQYARPHRSGATYFPNAVMPFRGLLESELHAHVLLCDLLEKDYPEISDGIRLWIMVQKETQEWENDPAFIEALGEVLKGSGELLQTKVLALSATYTVPFSSIRAAGNGFSVERKYFRGRDELREGDTLRLGERIRAEYRIHNDENRSHVLLTAPRPACLRPVRELSFCGGSHYVDVRSEATFFWYGSYPEEDTVVTEEFYVTQEGSFQSPALTIESLYAPHYRANDSRSSVLNAEN